MRGGCHNTNTMKKKTIEIIKWIVIGIAMIAAFSYAAKSDHDDAIISEMKNNGSYYELSEQHPDASDAELIQIYQDGKR